MKGGKQREKEGKEEKDEEERGIGWVASVERGMREIERKGRGETVCDAERLERKYGHHSRAASRKIRMNP